MARLGVVVFLSSSVACNRERKSLLELSRGARVVSFTFLLPFFLLGTGWSQSDPSAGIIPFSTQAPGLYESVDLASSNINVQIQVRNKIGKLPFSYKLVGNYGAYVAPGCGPNCKPPERWLVNGVGGGNLTPPINMGPSMGFTLSYVNETCSGINYTDIYQLSNFYVTDSTGASHVLSGMGPLLQNALPTCPQGTVLAGTTVDKSGYSLVATPETSGGYQSYYFTVYDRSGNAYSPGYAPYISGAPNTLVQDPDGATITSTSGGLTYGVITDTLGTTAITAPSESDPTYPLTYQYTNAAGSAESFKVNYSPYTQQTVFGCQGPADISPTAISMPSSITTPTETIVLTYETTPGDTHSPHYVTGRLASITYATGGSVTYSYSGGNNGINCNSWVVPTLTKTINDNNGNVNKWTYVNTNSLQPPSVSWQGGNFNYTVTVTDPASNQTVYSLWGENQTEVQYYEGAATGTPLKTVVTCYNQNYASQSICVSPTQVAVTISQTDVYTYLGSSKPSLVETIYDGYGNVSAVSNYDYGAAFPPSGTPLASTTTSYNTGSSCGTLKAYISDRPCTVTTYSSGTQVSQTTYTYNSTGHAIATSKWVSSTASPLNSSATYATNGVLSSVTDVNNTLTKYSNGPGVGACNGLLPVGTTYPVQLTTSQTWDCNGGVVTVSTDANGKKTTYNYVADPYYRPLSTTDPLTYATNYTYGTTTFESAMNFNGTTSTSDTLTTTDGLGRQIFTQTRQGQGSSTFDSTQTSYGWTTTTSTVAGGPFTKVSVPYSGTAGQSARHGTAVTTTQNDALGRPIAVTDGGGGTVSYTYVQNDVLQSVGPTQNFQKQLQYDGLGRLTSVCEVTSVSGSGSCGQSNPATGFLTNYTYDALGNLLTVTQNAQPGAIGGKQSRSYTYDGLSRLLSETNPEWGPGTAHYTYDVACGSYSASAGDLTTRLDNAGNTICYAYDSLHRLTDAGKSGPTCRHFRYDANLTPPSGVTVQLTLSRMEEAYTDACSGSKVTDEWFSYDADGRETDVYESTPHSGSPYYHASASYWANGTTETLSGIPSVPTMNYGAGGGGLDGEGRVTEITASTGQNPVNSVTYSPTTTTTALVGSLTQVTFGSLDSDGYQYDPNTGRMTEYSFNANGQSAVGKLTWNANGTLQQLFITDPFNSQDNQTCNNTYDDLARISGNNCGSVWAQTFSYDAFGNVTKSGSISWQPGYNASTNQYTLGGTSYDANGDLKTDTFNTYTWDVYGDLASVNGETLTYDAFGRTVENHSGANQFLYSPTGQAEPLAEMQGQVPEFVYVQVPGGAFAVYNSSGLLQYNHPDWLGSARLFSTPSRTAMPAMAYAPFGEGYAGGISWVQFTTAGNAPTVYDTENQSGSLEDFTFRRYSPVQGRWISPDPAGLGAVDPSNPQSWNRYSYVLNDPLMYTDPLGLYCYYGTTDADGNPDPNSSDSQDPGNFDMSMASGGTGIKKCQDSGGTWYQDHQSTTVYGNCPPGSTCLTGSQLADIYGPKAANNWSLYPPSMFTPPKNGVTAIIRAGPPNAKSDYCSHQANLAAAESVLPGLANAIQGDYRPIAATGASMAVQEYASDAAANSTSFLLTVRSWTGIPMSVTSKALSIVGYVGTAYTAYSALKAAQAEYAACMQ
jgi:RHS repeat-associated protein